MTQGTINIGDELQKVDIALDGALDDLEQLTERIRNLRARRAVMVSLFRQANAPERTDGPEEPPA